MSLREVGVRETRSYERGTRHRARDGSQDDFARQQRRRENGRRRGDERETRRSRESPATSEVVSSRSQARQIEHQSSLRSLISSSDVDSSEMEEEILRQITEDGLLDGIDLNNLNVAQEDELSERIADAYRRRHSSRPSRDNRVEESRGSNRRTHRSHTEQSQHRQAGRSSVTVVQPTSPSHPPISRPHLLEAYPAGNGHRRRTSSDHRRRTSPIPGRANSESQRPAAASATDLSDRPITSGAHLRQTGSASLRASEERRQASRSATDLSSQPQNSINQFAGLSNQGRRTTDPDSPSNRARDNSQANAIQNSRSRGDIEAAATTLPPSMNDDIPSNSTLTASPTQPSASQFPDQSNSVEDSSARRAPYPLDNTNSTRRPSPSSSKVSTTQAPQYFEPSITCNRCSKPHIEYELHQNCPICLGGNYNVCLRCYHRRLGCLRWYGFGNAAFLRYQRQSPLAGPLTSHESLHILIGHRYIRPALGASSSITGVSNRILTEDPSRRLQSGVFCSNCSAFANDCFWKCDVCNEGEWGFCNSCVNQGKCCTHPLLPLAHATSKPKSHSSSAIQRSEMSFDTTSTSTSSSSKIAFPGDVYKPLTFSIKCHICTYPIPPLTSRFHCLQCNAGDYDICTKCYLNLVSTGRISVENSQKGWRRCLELHRMIVFGFQDSPMGQKRVMINELVGGYALKDDPLSTSEETSLAVQGYTWNDGAKVQVRNSPKQPSHTLSPSSSPSSAQLPHPNKFPPNGGVGMRVLALWSYWPEENVKNSLAFPKGAVITEAVDVNGDWFWGVYAGSKGFLPGNYVKMLEMVSGPE